MSAFRAHGKSRGSGILTGKRAHRGVEAACRMEERPHSVSGRGLGKRRAGSAEESQGTFHPPHGHSRTLQTLPAHASCECRRREPQPRPIHSCIPAGPGHCHIGTFFQSFPGSGPLCKAEDQGAKASGALKRRGVFLPRADSVAPGMAMHEIESSTPSSRKARAFCGQTTCWRRRQISRCAGPV